MIRKITLSIVLLACICGCATRSTLRVMTYNIHHAAGADGRVDVERIAKVIKSADADLVALQEVDRCTKRSGGIDEAAELERLTGMNAIWGKAMDFDGGEYGQLILCSMPIRTNAVYHLPGSEGREPRIVLTGQVRVNRDLPAVIFASTHLEHQLPTDRFAQARALADHLVTTLRGPSIIAG